MGDCITAWQGDPADFRPGRPVLVGFPQDEGVRRNSGRVGAALAPDAIRGFLYRLTPGGADAELSGLQILDLGNLLVADNLEESQSLLAQVVAVIARRGAVPIVLGGGHETALGHYLGYASTGAAVGVVNLDAHLDVRPLLEGLAHSGSPFRQMIEHPIHPLPGPAYACLGAQPFAVARAHVQYVQQRGGQVVWREEVEGRLCQAFEVQHDRLTAQGRQVYLSIDADVTTAADAPGVSAVNPLGLPGSAVARCAFEAGRRPGTIGMDLVEINPRFDVDSRTARWGALVVWHFLAGLSLRR